MRELLFILILAVFLFTGTVSVKAAEPIKILLIPGHDNKVWGAQYGNIKEADMTLALANQIYDLLKKDEKFDVYITRDSEGYTKEFSDYFANQQDAISAFKENAKKLMQVKITLGSFIKRINPPHNEATKKVALKLYGFNKWANENKIDAMIHVHFNDYNRPNKWTVGEFKGFVIYMPEEQMVNFKESEQLAKSIFMQLKKKYTTSNAEKELGGLIPDQKLIALGSNDTLYPFVRSVLIEYGYIYEKKFRKVSTGRQAYKDMAELTTTGIKKYFFSKDGP